MIVDKQSVAATHSCEQLCWGGRASIGAQATGNEVALVFQLDSASESGSSCICVVGGRRHLAGCASGKGRQAVIQYSIVPGS